jgi:hypothetical protein
VGVQQKRKAAPQKVIGRSAELRHFNAPDHRLVEKVARDSRKEQNTHNDEYKIENAFAYKAVNGVHITDISIYEGRHLAVPLPLMDSSGFFRDYGALRPSLPRVGQAWA